MLQADYTGQDIYQAERFIQSALDALSAHVAILDDAGNIIGVNAAWCRFADDNGFQDKTYGIGTNYLKICDEAARRSSKEALVVAQGIRNVMTRRSSDFQIEYPCHGNKIKRWFVMHVTRFDWQGTPRYIIAHQNVTELKRVQVELRESKERIQEILDNVSNAIFTMDDCGQIESVNPAGEKIFACTKESLIGQPINTLMAEPHRTQDTIQLIAALHQTPDHELIGQRKDGSPFPMYLAINYLRQENRHIYTIIIQDITERRRMESEMREKERLSLALEKEHELRDLKNRFISMMSHELRTPLASILLSSDMLKLYGDKASPEERMQYFDNITTQVEHLTELIKDVNIISHTDVKSALFNPEKTDIVEYCRNIVREFNLTYRNTHTITFESKRKNILTMIDLKLMRQVLTNVLANAIKYSPKGGEVHVKVRSGARTAYIDVSDQGIGIPAADHQRLFEPFHRASNVENFPGTGLGLAIAKQALDLHNGSISVTSEVGSGTTMTIALPISIETE